jgi:hypothetical protein
VRGAVELLGGDEHALLEELLVNLQVLGAGHWWVRGRGRRLLKKKEKFKGLSLRLRRRLVCAVRMSIPSKPIPCPSPTVPRTTGAFHPKAGT